MTAYATLADVRSEMAAVNTADDSKIMRGLRQVSARIDGMFKKGPNLFAPSIQTRAIALDAGSINSVDRTLMMRSPNGVALPLLALTGVTSGSALVVGTNVQAYPASGAPYYQLQLLGDCWASWYRAYCSGVAGAQNTSVSGIWGYHEDYATAWLDVDTLSAGITTATATTLTVVDVDGENPYAEAPRISAGHLIRIDDEWMDVVKTNTATNTVTVRRGVNGSAAAVHGTNAIVSVWQVDESIRRAVTRQVAFQYARRGAYETRRVQEFTAVDFPADVLREFYGLLKQFANM
jgi:hypothetical protein